MVLINNKLILLINSFSKTEISQFKKFISAPYFSKGRNYLPFLKDVLKIKSKLKSNTFQNKSDRISQNKDFREQTLRNRYSELYKLAEEFLIQKELSENKSDRDKYLLNKLLERKLNIPFNLKYERTRSELSRQKFDKTVYRDLSQIGSIHSVFLESNNKVEDIYREYYDRSKIILCLNLLDFFEIGLNFKQMEFDNRKFEPNYITGILNNMNLTEMMKEFSRSGSLIFNVTAMMFYLYKAFEIESGKENYLESHKIFTKISSDLKDGYKIEFFKVMINYCIHKLNEGDLNYRYDLFNLYNKKLDLNLTEDFISRFYIHNQFRDYVYIGLSINELKWTERFISKYSIELPIEIREAETKISYAKLEFKRKNFKKSLTNLNEVTSKHYLQYLDVSIFKLYNYYELRNFEQAYLEMDKQKQYCRNHKEIPKIQYEHHLNFTKLLSKLIRIKTEPGKFDKELILKELNEYEYLSKNEWLKEKINQLKK